MIVEGAAISVIVTGVTGGLGGTAAAAAAAARVRAQAPRFSALLTAFRSAAAVSAARLERARDELALVRARVDRFLKVPARNEVGAIKPSAWMPPRKRGWLRDHEVPPGHTIREHVGKSTVELSQRLKRYPRLKRASTFVDEASAERWIAAVIQRRDAEITRWLLNPKSPRLTLIEDMGAPTGQTVTSRGVSNPPTGLRVVLIVDDAEASGWRILTAFPD